ncbi:MAG TPA: hypothetical protein VJH37_01520 [Candidatus Nanoarchaeia archaeon]|nr:hypothetical protein [Candidatus Nanoarchaeia archaeon]
MVGSPSFLQYYLFVVLCVLLALHLKDFYRKKRKWRSTAILLTFLVGGLSWFYTYQKNKKHCWFILCVAVLAVPFPILLSWNPEMFFQTLVFPLFGTSEVGQWLFRITSSLVVTLVAIPGFVWPLFYFIRQPAKFYKNYYKR